MRRFARWLEARAQTAAIGATALMLPGGPRRARPDWSKARRLLFTHFDGIGDLLMATGVLRAIADRHPHLRLDVLADARTLRVLEGLPFIAECIAAPKSAGDLRATLAALRGRGYDVVIDSWMDRVLDGTPYQRRVSRRSALIFWALRPRYRVGQGGRPGASIYNVPVFPPAEGTAHHGQRLAAFLGPFGLPTEASPPPVVEIASDETAAAERLWEAARQRVRGSGESLRLFINISAWNPVRIWPPESYATLLRHIRAAHPGASIVLSGVPQPPVLAVLEELGATYRCEINAPPLRGITTLEPTRALIAAIASAQLVISPDTSVPHIAAALGVPMVAFFLPANKVRFAPSASRGRLVFAPEEHMASLRAQDVIAAFDDVVASLAAAGPSPNARPRPPQPAASGLRSRSSS